MGNSACHPLRASITALCILTLAACGKGGQPGAGGAAPGGPGAGMPPPVVDVMVATAGQAALTQDLPGRLEAVRTAQVRARVEGILEKRLFAEGSEVKQGQTLFQIDDRDYKATAISAKVDVEVMKGAINRYTPLLESKAVSQQEFDQAQVKLLQTQAALTRANINLENTRVPAPISGRIGRALVTEGALVGKGESTHLATIEQIDPIYVNFTQSNSDMLRLRAAIASGKLHQANQAELELVQEDGSVYPLPGKLMFSDLAVDPQTGAVAMRALFPNPRRQLLPGQFVHVRLKQAQLDNTYRVPQRAVQSGAQGQFVMLVNAQGQAEVRPITTSGMSGGDWLVSAGLQGGEQIIVQGLQKARPGSTVQAQPWQPAAAATPPPAAAPPKADQAAPANQATAH